MRPEREFNISEASIEGKRLIDAWYNAKDGDRMARDQANIADCELRNATTSLGRWLTPKDGKVGEKFSIWFGDKLIECEVLELSGNGTYGLTIRSRK